MYCVLIVAKCIVNKKRKKNNKKNLSINSSKVYCKYFFEFEQLDFFFVLIVAKCIVNYELTISIPPRVKGINSSKVYCKSKRSNFFYFIVSSINSSKVYCKYSFNPVFYINCIVLIVAKCIVNVFPTTISSTLDSY